MTKLRRFFKDLYYGAIVYKYPLCCVWHYSWTNLLLEWYPAAWMNGCWENKDRNAGFAHCPKCAQRIHPIYRTFEPRSRTCTQHSIILPPDNYDLEAKTVDKK